MHPIPTQSYLNATRNSLHSGGYLGRDSEVSLTLMGLQLYEEAQPLFKVDKASCHLSRLKKL